MKPLAFDAMVHFELPASPLAEQNSALTDEEWENGVQKKLKALHKTNTRALNAGTHPQDRRWHRLRDISADFLGESPLLFAQGLHPWWVDGDVKKLLFLLESQLDEQLESCVALGECGLDKHARAEQTLQLQVFSAQLKMAASRGLPVVAHVVGWHGLAVECIRKSGARGVVHGFSGSAEMMKAYLELGWYLSIGKSIFTSPKSQNAAAAVPGDRLLLESDGSEDFAEIATAVAEFRETSLEDVLVMTTLNAGNLFQLES